MLIFFAVIWKW